MINQIVSQDKAQDYCGALLSDVTYKFFADSYLLSKPMFHEEFQQWILIKFTWLNGLTKKHYAAHFTTLMRQIKEADMISGECDTLVRQVVNLFSGQMNIFIMAYMEVFEETDHVVALNKLQ